MKTETEIRERIRELEGEMEAAKPSLRKTKRAKRIEYIYQIKALRWVLNKTK